MRAADIHPYEAAWLAASVVVTGQVESFDPVAGVTIRVVAVNRGDVPDTLLTLQGTERSTFLNEPGADVVAFIHTIDGAQATLVYPPGAGGLIWQDTDSLPAIVAAHDNALASLESADYRTQLAAAYFLAVEARTSETADLRPSLVETALWGLEHPVAEVNQAAVDILDALGIEIDNYHPNYRLEVKVQATQRLREQLAAERR